MTKRIAIQRLKIIADLLRGEPQRISDKNWRVTYRLNCIGKTLLSCIEKIDNPAKDTKTFEGSKDGADIYFRATMAFFKLSEVKKCKFKNRPSCVGFKCPKGSFYSSEQGCVTPK